MELIHNEIINFCQKYTFLRQDFEKTLPTLEIGKGDFISLRSLVQKQILLNG